jgi:hypothetical protein
MDMQMNAAFLRCLFKNCNRWGILSRGYAVEEVWDRSIFRNF